MNKRTDGIHPKWIKVSLPNVSHNRTPRGAVVSPTMQSSGGEFKEVAVGYRGPSQRSAAIRKITARSEVEHGEMETGR